MVRHSLEGASAPVSTLPHRLPERQRLHAGFDSHREHLRDSALEDVPGAVVHQLRDRARADRADVVGLVTYRVEHMLVPFVDELVSADPDGQVSRPSTLRSAAYGRIQYVSPLLAHHLVNAANQRRRAGAEVEVDLPRADTVLNAIFSERDGFYLHRPWQGREDDLAVLG